MFITYNNIDHGVVYVPDDCPWKIFQRVFDGDFDDNGLYLTFTDRSGEHEVQLRDTDRWAMGRRLSCYSVGDLYSEILEVILNRLAADPTLKFIDLDAIEKELIDNKYKQLWLENGYIELDEQGNW